MYKVSSQTNTDQVEAVLLQNVVDITNKGRAIVVGLQVADVQMANVLAVQLRSSVLNVLEHLHVHTKGGLQGTRSHLK